MVRDCKLAALCDGEMIVSSEDQVRRYYPVSPPDCGPPCRSLCLVAVSHGLVTDPRTANEVDPAQRRYEDEQPPKRPEEGPT